MTTPTQDRLREKLVHLNGLCLGDKHACIYETARTDTGILDETMIAIEAYKDNAVNEAKKTSYEEGGVDSIEHMVGWHKSEVNKLLDNIQAQQMAFRQEHGRLLLTYASRFHSIIEAERNNLNKSRGENQ